MRLGWIPDTPGRSSSPAGSNKKGVISLTESWRLICHGMWTLCIFSGSSGADLIRTPDDSRTRKAEQIVSTRPSAFLPDAPTLIMVWNENWLAFSFADFTLSLDASRTPKRARSSQDSCGSCIFLGTVFGENDLPKTICTTDSSPLLVADIAASPARTTLSVTSALSESTGLVTERYWADDIGFRKADGTSESSISPCPLNSSIILPLYVRVKPTRCAIWPS